MNTPIMAPDRFRFQSESFANPGAGVGFSQQWLDSNLRSLLTFRWAFIASAAIGARNLWFTLTDTGGVIYFEYFVPFATTAGQITIFNGFVGADQTLPLAATRSVFFPLPPDLLLSSSFILSINSAIFDAADTIIGINTLYKLWPME